MAPHQHCDRVWITVSGIGTMLDFDELQVTVHHPATLTHRPPP